MTNPSVMPPWPLVQRQGCGYAGLCNRITRNNVFQLVLFLQKQIAQEDQNTCLEMHHIALSV